MRAIQEQLDRAASVPEACRALLDAIVGLTGGARTWIYVRVDDTLRGHGLGVSDEHLQSLLASRGPESRMLWDALERGSPTGLRDEPGLALLDVRTATAIPFPGPRSEIGRAHV